MISEILSGILWPIQLVGVFISLFAMASLVPSLVKKGNIDLFLSKPISRFELLMGKYIGGATIVAGNLIFLIFSFWLIIGLKFSFWSPDFLVAIPAIFLTFEAFFSIMTLLSILTGNSVLPLAVAVLSMLVVGPILSARESIPFLQNEVAQKMMDLFYYIFPQSTDIMTEMTEMIKPWLNTEPSAMPFVLTGILAVVYFGLAVVSFYRKDY